ncbi:extensin [Pseudorhizobium halotolerans]|uniref:Extensin n=1 Tax=Pseudorhizobium halotolerans TaxID=1233081 RepID=A0ABN7JNX5_9HYPH|nr:extensin family protein [Pseudorhizobium halotolerans]CAD7033649.1 extensin [Pseudorhizobium halotolerans]
MAYASLSRQVLASLMITTMLVSCSAEGLMPPASIDGETRVSSIGAMSEPTGVRQPYQAPVAPVSQVSGGYIDPYPTDAGAQSYPIQQAPAAQSSSLPMIDSDEALGLQSSGSPAAIPEEGVNMDAQFGFVDAGEPQVVGLAQEQDQMIAEGATAQPVVDGIGTDNPVSLGAPPGFLAPPDDQIISVPPKRQGAGIQQPQNQALVWGDQSPVVAPTRLPPEEPQQVAMLAPGNPMAEREPIRPRAVMPQSEVSCRAELRRLGVQFRDIPRISDGPSCGIEHPVLLSGFSGNIALKPATKLNCQTTLALAKWVKFELAPSSRYRYLSGVKTIESMGGYSCRRMNNSRQKRNPMSEHARGNAIDLGKFVLKNGKKIDVRKKNIFAFRERGLLNTVRDDSCKYFHTVLGPGSNKEHWNHFHFDLRSRKSGSKYCD